MKLAGLHCYDLHFRLRKHMPTGLGLPGLLRTTTALTPSGHAKVEVIEEVHEEGGVDRAHHFCLGSRSGNISACHGERDPGALILVEKISRRREMWISGRNEPASFNQRSGLDCPETQIE